MMKLSELDSPPTGGGFPLGEILDWLLLLTKSVWSTLQAPHLLGIGLAMLLVWGLFALLVYIMFVMYTQRRRRKRRTYMSDQEVWHRLNRNVSDAVQDAVDSELLKGYLTHKQAQDYLNRMAKSMKSKELQSRQKTRGKLTAGYQQRLIWKIRNRLASAFYRTAEGLRTTAPIPGDPPPVIEPKPKRQTKNKLDAALQGSA